MRKRACLGGLALLGLTAAFATSGPATADSPTPRVELEARAVLDANTFAPGPTSGRQTSPANGVTPPYVNKQPVQGFSAVLDNHDGTFMAMSDNGFGSFENSADYNLRVYRIRPDFETKKGGSGSIAVLDYIELRDPDKKIPWAITNFFSADRVLTGADFDIESLQRTPDGTLWFGDEFGPFILHTDATGRVLQAPIALPDFDNPGQEVRSPQNPKSEEASAVRIMNAVREHARSHGNVNAKPVFSPWEVMLDDGNAATVVGNRVAPVPAGVGMVPASSDVFNVASLKSAGYDVVTWTVNSSSRMTQLLQLRVNGIISDRPDLLYAAIASFDADGNGVAGDYLNADGTINSTKVDAQGHRGARNLKPENTLPAIEAALNNLMTTLETDAGVTSDGKPVLSHDPHLQAAKCRRADGTPYNVASEELIKDLTLAQLQARYVCDLTPRGAPQTNSTVDTPVSVGFAGETGLIDPYIMPSLQQLFDFVDAYVAYYKTGVGTAHPDATRRWTNAERVRFNIETKINPRTDFDEPDHPAQVYASRTHAFEPFTDAVAGVIAVNGETSRADIQSFDFRSLLRVQELHPSIRTVYLFGDFPKYGDTSDPNSDDGTNLQPQVAGGNTPWFAGLPWPYRETKLANPFRAQRSGGFEGMALSADGTKLYPLLELPLSGAPAGALYIHEFDIASRAYTGNRWTYQLDPRGTNIGDFVLEGDSRHGIKGLVIERDGSQGNLNGFKAIFEVTLGAPGTTLAKELIVDLLKIQDPKGISLPALPGDLGLGDPFAFPFVTIEDVVILDDRHIGVLNDNNYPGSVGRHLSPPRPDDNEFIILKLETPLGRPRSR